MLKIDLTDGAVRNGYLNIYGSEKFFPAKFHADGSRPPMEEFDLILPDGRVLKDHVLTKFNRLKRRHGKLFESFKLRAGDEAQIRALDEGRYNLTFSRK